MTFVEPTLGLSRRKRSILYCGYTKASDAESALILLAASSKADLYVCRTSDELRKTLERERNTVCLVALEAHLDDSVSVARSVADASPLSEIVILATEEEEHYLRQKLGAAPRLGSHWQFAGPVASGLAKVLETSYQRADQRQTTRTTLDRFNARLTAASEPVDTRELRQLVISDRFLSSVLESTFDAVIMIDLSGKVAAFSPSAEKLFERPQPEVISHPIWSIAEGVWSEQIRTVMNVRKQGELLQTSFQTVHGTRYVEVSSTPVFDSSRNTIATSLIVRDVSQRIQSEKALRTNEKLAAVGRLASSIAHEINNPLEAVTNLIYIARQLSSELEVQTYLDMADSELRRMSSITSQTLRFHKQSTAPRAVTCDELLDSVLTVFQGRLGNSAIRTEKRMLAVKQVSCFDGEIRQVLTNLVGNAIDAMHGAEGRLILRSRESTDWITKTRGITMTVADSGPGMDRATLERIFEPFYTTKGNLGTGLGLWISSEIVTRHSGRLRVRSRKVPSHGTVFALFLPFSMRAGKLDPPC